MSDRYLLKLGPTGNVLELTAESRSINPSYEEGLRRSERAASGKLRTDWIAIKRAWELQYEAVPTATITRLEYLFNLKSTLTLQVQEGASLVTYYVKMEPFGKSVVTTAHGGLWETTVNLREV